MRDGFFPLFVRSFRNGYLSPNVISCCTHLPCGRKLSASSWLRSQAQPHWWHRQLPSKADVLAVFLKAQIFFFYAQVPVPHGDKE